MHGVCQSLMCPHRVYTAEGEEAPPPGGWTDVQDADLSTAFAQQVADIVSIDCRERLLTLDTKGSHV